MRMGSVTGAIDKSQHLRRLSLPKEGHRSHQVISFLRR